MAVGLTVRIVDNKFPRIIKQLQPAADEITREVLNDGLAIARRLVPVDTGELRDSLGVEMEGTGAGVLYAGAAHARYVEFGTVKMPAQPYLLPASEAMRPIMIDKMRDLESRLK